jgi:hypothetical protein
MASYQDLGPRTVLGVSDAQAQINPFLLGTGWDAIFTPDVLNTSLTRTEIYHAAVNGPIGSSLAVLRNGKIWDYVLQGWQNSWDPSQPLPLGQTDTVQFCWTTAFTSPPYNMVSNIQATATIWLRQEIAALGL